MTQEQAGRAEGWFIRQLEHAEALGGPSPAEAIESLYAPGVSIEIYKDQIHVAYSETSGRWMPQSEVDWAQWRLESQGDHDQHTRR